ncbi:Archaeal fructose-1,6-bisphosphatase [Caenispirillum salinarum AK4]|uniref:Archaeal fructose-1,6-bisphosphatase n=1 Tax=Caenispirillum salinarum AK4 TaxID=1238182 RepID=K9H2V7_9PROT|nr:inositol monophosphatase [Caenispirillum salinarum]EKV31394.1 Archaeal fructose-1,6-bisphosphatase [Caenispirillum salinarum AK4]
MTVDPDSVAAIIRDVARDEILPRYNTLEAHEVRSKSHPGDLVTAADEAAEAALATRLRALLPGSVVVGEEGTAADPRLLDRLKEDAPVWVLDPVDGTRNFAHGVPRFAVMVALVRGGDTVCGWILDPVADVLYVAEQGAGSWREGKRIRVSPARGPEALVGATGYRHAKLFKPHGIRTRQSGSAAHDYMQASDGRVDFAVFRRRLNPWDHAAGALIHHEAGGFGRTVDGDSYRPGDREGDHLILAPDEDTWSRIRDILLPHVRGEKG